jgi:hypothetical protein
MMFYRKSRNIQAKIKEEEEMCLTGTGPKFTSQLLPPRPDGGPTTELQNRTTTDRTTTRSGISHGLGSWVQWVPELHRFSLS